MFSPTGGVINAHSIIKVKIIPNQIKSMFIAAIEIAKGVIPFVIIMLFAVFLVYLFPQIALYIPFKL